MLDVVPTQMNLIRAKVITEVASAITQARKASDLNHPGLVGSAREILVERMLKPCSSPELRYGTGKLTDHCGMLSRELDVIISAPSILPPALYNDRLGVFPIESCLYVVEVKSTLTRQELQRCVDNARSIRSLSSLPARHITGLQDVLGPMLNPIYTVFAYGSDLSADPSSEIQRLVDLTAGSNLITTLCIVGRGYWCHSNNSWVFVKASQEFSEVMGFLAGIANTTPLQLIGKGRPCFGNYLVEDPSKQCFRVSPTPREFVKKVNVANGLRSPLTEKKL